MALVADSVASQPATGFRLLRPRGLGNTRFTSSRLEAWNQKKRNESRILSRSARFEQRPQQGRRRCLLVPIAIEGLIGVRWLALLDIRLIFRSEARASP